MPAAKIESAVVEFSPEPILCWCNGQSLESRYSSSVSGGGGVAGAKVVGGAVLRRQLGKARLPGAERMPRFPVIAVSSSQVFLFDGPVPKKPPFATLRRDQTQVIHGGNFMWRRLDLIVSDGEASHSYTMMVSGLSGGTGRLRKVVDMLGSSAT